MRNSLFGILCLLLQLSAFCQNQKKADSILLILTKEQFDDSTRCSILRHLIRFETNPEKQLVYSKELLDLGIKSQNEDGIYNGYYFGGSAQIRLGNLPEALKAFHKALGHSPTRKSKSEILTAIAGVYKQNSDYKNAFSYYNQSIAVFEGKNDMEPSELNTWAIAYSNAGDGYLLVKNLDSALLYFEKAKVIFDQTNHTIGKAYSIGNISLVYAERGDHELAEENIHKAVEILMGFKDYYSVSIFYTYMADIYSAKGETNRALEYALESHRLASEYALKEQIRDADLKLYELYQKSGKHERALHYYKEYVLYKDSILNTASIQELANLRTEFEVGQKQAEVDLLQVQKENQRLMLMATAGIAVLLVILAIIIYTFYRTKSKINFVLAAQKEALESLNQTKDKFFSIISHDLRGPVSSFQGVGRMIKYFVESKNTEQLLVVADEMEKSVDQLSGLLDNLLTWAMQQQGHFPNVPEKLNLSEMSTDLTGTLSNMAKGKNITLTTDIQGDIQLWGDKNTTLTILRNLMNNALKFTPEGGKVTLSSKETNGYAEIRISDTGVGIPKDKLKKIFSLHDKKSTYGTKGEKGLGLGLQLVHEFLEMNKGSIAVESEEGIGTTFILHLPLYASDKLPA